MSQSGLPINKNKPQKFLYKQGIKVLGDGALFTPDAQVRRTGLDHLKETAKPLGALALGAALFGSSLVYATEHGSAGPLHNGPDTTPISTIDQEFSGQPPSVIQRPSPTSIELPIK